MKMAAVPDACVPSRAFVNVVLAPSAGIRATCAPVAASESLRPSSATACASIMASCSGGTTATLPESADAVALSRAHFLLDYANCFTGFGGNTLYAKLTVDSVDAANRLIYTRTVVDPNCGYRNLVAGAVPKN